ncbi:protein zyg-11 homolog B-like [Mizuhopecten yessoensis]|uniref:protein zyg-11 homolog B-like n=1 Tax=Mizuhopecten yessoensis TaxID=6573 RepID=UPI000B458AB3|nr:protein zyg-11 homolog B-like [Mizuhopecten yessoensis]XP_021353884.1 protein zyg-11 homolog B-like [Mizuhopecten yessoensis]
MYDTPVSLQNCCVDFICDNLSTLCLASAETPLKLAFKDSDVYFHGDLSEQLLHSLCEKGKLTDETLSLFDPNVTNLKRVCIHDAQLTTKGLRTLKTHRISELEITGLKSVTVNDAIGCLGEWALCNLRSLNVCNSTFLNSTKFCVVVSLSKLRNLHSLNVSRTEFNKHGLEIIAEDLPCLESLDISCTQINDISPLRKCRDRLKSLSMYNLRAANKDDVVPVLYDLTKLVHLDVSDDSVITPVQHTFMGGDSHAKFPIQDLLEKSNCLPYLTSLDISGKEGAAENTLRRFLSEHKNIKFLGLARTTYCEMPMFCDDDRADFSCDIVISGDANERQVLEALRRYVQRVVYVQKSLYTLFRLTQAMEEPREDIVRLVLPAMKSHPKQLGVQMAATACLYNLSKGDIGNKVHPSCLKHVVNLTLLSMDNFPNHQQLQKNALLTLCSDRILQDVSFDRYRCAKLVMECLCQFDDPSMNRMSVAICSILAAKISTSQTSLLGAKTKYMQKMLDLVRLKVQARSIDITLKFTLSALWNLTDESPPTCRVFLKEKGLDLFMDTLMVVMDMERDVRVQVETKILGLLNNIAEVRELRGFLMRTDSLILLKKLMHAEQIDVSYFAAGIIANLASDGAEAWLVSSTDREEILGELGEVVLKWEQPKGEMVAYRSFKPFFPLLRCFSVPTVQLWAVWAIQHVCTKNGDRYCLMLEEEGGSEILQQLIENPETNSDVAAISINIIELSIEKRGNQ